MRGEFIHLVQIVFIFGDCALKWMKNWSMGHEMDEENDIPTIFERN